jgi:hypothetical protein
MEDALFDSILRMDYYDVLSYCQVNSAAKKDM